MQELVSVFMSRTPLGWLQLMHRPGRMFVAVMGVAFANLLVFMQLGFMGMVYDTTIITHLNLKGDIVLTGSITRQLAGVGTMPRRRLIQALEVEGVEEAAALYYANVDWINPYSKQKGTFGVFGVDPDRPVFTNDEINRQLWKLKIPDTILFDRRARGEWKDIVRRVSGGESVTAEIAGRRASVEGLFSIGAAINSAGILVTSDTTWLRMNAQRSAGTVSLALVTVKPGYDPEEVAKRLSAWLPASDTRVLTYPAFIEKEKSFMKSDNTVAYIFSFGVIMGLAIGAAIVYQVLSSDVADHLKEYATFKAMGFTQGFLLAIVFEEALILAVLGFCPSLILSLGLYRVVQLATALPMLMPLDRPVTVFALTVGMCSLSGAIATRRLASADPADVF